MEAAVRKATVLQLCPTALADICLVVHHFMTKPEKALGGGTSAREIELLQDIAQDLVPTSVEWFMKTIRAQCLHMIAQWQPFLTQV
jgi:hypothetical protein